MLPPPESEGNSIKSAFDVQKHELSTNDDDCIFGEEWEVEGEPEEKSELQQIKQDVRGEQLAQSTQDSPIESTTRTRIETHTTNSVEGRNINVYLAEQA
ncbi:MAG: hypothetical protein ACRDF4_00430, partial [Rhabdochlamydiaceae bacterium]